MENKGIEKDILKNSFYMIVLFLEQKEKLRSKESEDEKAQESNEKHNIKEYIEKNRSIITNLKLQKIMYFLEAYYMTKEQDELEMFDSEWSAWDYGPVSKELYNYFKKYGSIEITLTKEEKNIASNLPEKNKKYIKKIYNIFGALNAYDLVSLTHMKDSPWDEVRKEEKYDFQILNDSIIDKQKTKIWFKNTFKFIANDEENK